MPQNYFTYYSEKKEAGGRGGSTHFNNFFRILLQYA